MQLRALRSLRVLLVERVLALKPVQALAIVGDPELLRDHRGNGLISLGAGSRGWRRGRRARGGVTLQHDRHREQRYQQHDRGQQQSPVAQVAQQVLEEGGDANLLHGVVVEVVLVSVEAGAVLESVVEVDVELEVSVGVASAGPLGVAPAVIP